MIKTHLIKPLLFATEKVFEQYIPSMPAQENPTEEPTSTPQEQELARFSSQLMGMTLDQTSQNKEQSSTKSSQLKKR